MFDDISALSLARAQFAFTVSFHFIFPAFSIGLASYLAVLEGLWLKTGKEVYLNLFKYWLKIFALAFAMGVVSGITMSYQFGTNWSVFSDKAGPVIGPLMAYEVMTAFFLEAGFLGVMLFGMNRVGPRLHYVATLAVAIGTFISAFWILSANSWMQTPQGFEIVDGQVVPVDWLAVIFNPSFPYRLLHMTVAAFLSSALFVGASAAWHLLRGNQSPAIRKMFSMALWMTLLVAPVQALIGDMHGLNTLKHQPAKIAAIEGHWENPPGEPTPLLLFGWPDMDQERTRYGLEIPALGSLILTHSLDKQVPALKEFAPEDRPNSTVVFWSFRLMAGLGMLMLLLGALALWLRRGDRLYHSRPFLRFALWMGPSGLIAILAGWVTTEVGRQPWVVYGVQRTAEAVSAHGDLHMSVSLLTFIVVYSAVFGVGYSYMLRLIRKGPQAVQPATTGTPARPLSAATEGYLQKESR